MMRLMMVWMAVTLLATACTKPAEPLPAGASEVRETRTFTVNGVAETWQLVWIGAKTEVCEAENIDMSMTCPCAGLAYGEGGNLWLVRSRGGHEVERMDLRPLYAGSQYAFADNPAGMGFVQRYPMKESDIDAAGKETRELIDEIKRRPAPQVMTPGDYDHDGQASEFLLLVDTLPCGKLQYVAVGVSKADPRLHAFVSAEEPDKPLELPERPWQALLASPAPSKVTIWQCGDHGSDAQTDVTVSARDGAFHADFENTDCSKLPPKQGGWNGTG